MKGVTNLKRISDSDLRAGLAGEHSYIGGYLAAGSAGYSCAALGRTLSLTCATLEVA